VECSGSKHGGTDLTHGGSKGEKDSQQGTTYISLGKETVGELPWLDLTSSVSFGSPWLSGMGMSDRNRRASQ